MNAVLDGYARKAGETITPDTPGRGA